MNKTKYFFAAILLIFTVISGCSKTPVEPPDPPDPPDPPVLSDEYFWSQGEKIPLERMDNRFHIVFFEENIDSLKNELERTGAVLSRMGTMYWENICSHRRIKHATVEGYYSQIAVALLQTIHWAPYFKMEFYGRTIRVWIQNLFSIKLWSAADLPLLEKLAEEHAVIIINESSFLPRWFLLGCTLLSSGNSLQMANFFYETGLFESYSPGIIGAGFIGI